MIPHSSPILLVATPLPISTSGGQYFVLDKPAGMTCSEDPDCSNTLRALASEVVGQRLHLAHRLDQCVTGCIVLASSAKAAAKARKLMQFSKDGPSAAEKHYIARVVGKLPPGLQGNMGNWPGLEQVVDGDLSFDTNSKALWEELLGRPKMKVRKFIF